MAEESLTLVHGEGSNCCQRVKWVLGFKKIPYATVDVAPFTEEDMAALTPLAQVPCLKVGSVTLTESMAIAEYLEERQPAPPLLPADPLQRAEVRELCEAVNTFVHPMQRTRVVKFFVPGADKAAATALRVRWLGESLAAVERMPRSAEGFAVGGVFSLADVFIVPVLVKFVGMGGGLGRLPRLASLLSACLKDPAALAAAPKDLELGKLKPGVA